MLHTNCAKCRTADVSVMYSYSKVVIATIATIAAITLLCLTRDCVN